MHHIPIELQMILNCHADKVTYIFMSTQYIFTIQSEFIAKHFDGEYSQESADNMRFRNVVLILCAVQECEGFLLGIEKSFDLSKFRGPVPTDKDVYRNVVSYELCLKIYRSFCFEASDLANQTAISHYTTYKSRSLSIRCVRNRIVASLSTNCNSICCYFIKSLQPTRLSLATCWQIVEWQDDNKLSEQLVTSLLSQQPRSMLWTSRWRWQLVIGY
jgi:hypothetical protein